MDRKMFHTKISPIPLLERARDTFSAKIFEQKILLIFDQF